MTRILRAVAVLGLGLVVNASALAAQLPIKLGIGGGPSYPVGDLGDAHDPGFHALGTIRFDPPVLPLGLRADVKYERFDFEVVEAGGTPGASLEGSSRILAGLADATLEVVPLGPIRPYIMAGLGVFNLKSDIEGAGEDREPESATRFGIDGGVGVQLRLPEISLFAEARLHRVNTDEGLVGTDDVLVFPITIGILF